MRCINTGTRFLIRDYTNREGIDLKRHGVNIVYDEKWQCLVADDNIFNRILLNTFVKLHSGIPENIVLNPSLFDYQREDVLKSLPLMHFMNKNKPGAGKTLEAIEYCRCWNLKRILIICPKSVIPQWYSQFAIWWPEATHLHKKDVTESAVIFVTNYEFFDKVPKFAKLKNRAWDIIICDESHRIKNQQSKRTVNIKSIPCVRRMALTGTPILNRPGDLWSQLHWLNPFYSGSSYWKFAERFCAIEDDHFGKHVEGLTLSDHAKELLSRVLDLITVSQPEHLQRTKGKQLIDIPLCMDKEQQRRYRDIAHLALDELNAEGITIKNGLDQQVKMQMATSAGVTINGKLYNTKFDWIKEQLEINPSEQYVIFSNFSTAINALVDFLGKDIARAYTGAQTSEQRTQLVQDFSAKKFTVLAGTIGALGTGVDGLQQTCSNMIFLDRYWNPPINEQAEARLDRTGQTQKVTIYNLRIPNTIDDYVVHVNETKNNDIKELTRWIESWL